MRRNSNRARSISIEAGSGYSPASTACPASCFSSSTSSGHSHAFPPRSLPEALRAVATKGVTTMKTCLVVDDSGVVRRIARRILEELAFNVSEAGDGMEALERCGQGMPDAILLDWNMPVMDGPSFLRALRGSAGGTEPKVIFCTTENDMDHI